MRLLVALVVVAVALVAGRDGIAAMLVSRGDTFYRAGQLPDAQVYYARALAVSHWNAQAANRYILSTSHDSREAEGALHMAQAFVRHYPDDVTLRRDLAVCYTGLRRYPEAARAWDYVVRHADDPRVREQAAFFAGIMLVRNGDRHGARAYVPIVATTNARLAAVLEAQTR